MVYGYVLLRRLAFQMSCARWCRRARQQETIPTASFIPPAPLFQQAQSGAPYATGVIKTYDGTIAGIRLLGSARRTADVAGSSYAYQSLDIVMANASDNYFASGEALSVRIARSTNTWPAK